MIIYLHTIFCCCTYRVRFSLDESIGWYSYNTYPVGIRGLSIKSHYFSSELYGAGEQKLNLILHFYPCCLQRLGVITVGIFWECTFQFSRSKYELYGRIKKKQKKQQLEFYEKTCLLVGRPRHIMQAHMQGDAVSINGPLHVPHVEETSKTIDTCVEHSTKDNVRTERKLWWTDGMTEIQIETKLLTDGREHAENPYHVDELAEDWFRFRVPVPVHVIVGRPWKVHPLADARMYTAQQQQRIWGTLSRISGSISLTGPTLSRTAGRPGTPGRRMRHGGYRVWLCRGGH